jgi:hypothetical protein
MSARRVFVLRDAPYARQAFAFLAEHRKAHAQAGRPLAVQVTEHRATRTPGQNARMWAMPGDVSRQVDWHGQRLRAEEWKDVFTAALKRQKVVPGIDGGFVVLGASSREMTVGELSELLELILAFGTEHGLRFRDDPDDPPLDACSGAATRAVEAVRPAVAHVAARRAARADRDRGSGGPSPRRVVQGLPVSVSAKCTSPPGFPPGRPRSLSSASISGAWVR